MDEIRLRRGEDVTRSIEDRFLANDSEVDLINLCTNLRNGPDADKLLKYTLELFSRQRNLRNARRVVEALGRLDRDQELIDFLGNCNDLVDLDDDLASIKAWTLFNVGRVSQAREIVERLVWKRDNPNDSRLQMNLLLAMGEWDKFSHIVDREWEQRETRDPKFLLQLALLTADFDQQRALLLTQEAATKGFDDPAVLASAAMLAYGLGHDELAMPWIALAARLSSPEEGPVITKSLPEILEGLTASGDRTRGIDEAVSAGQIPIHLAASMGNTSIARILVTQPIHNERERDPRRRTVVPVRHGSRGLADVSQVQAISADFTSLLLVSELDLLPQLSNRFQRIQLPWSTMELLLTEAQSCRFHQPSRVARAKRLRALLADQILRPIQGQGQAPQELGAEIGQELAELLVAAKASGGRVVRPLPIYRVNSFMETSATLGVWATLVMTTTQLVDALETEAVLDQQTATGARALLASMDRGDPLGSDDAGDGPLFLDGLTISHLEDAGLLEQLRRSKRAFMVHPNLVGEVDPLIATESDTARSLDVLDRLRAWIRDSLAMDKVSLMPRARLGDIEGGVRIRAFQELVTSVTGSDAVLRSGLDWAFCDTDSMSIQSDISEARSQSENKIAALEREVQSLQTQLSNMRSAVNGEFANLGKWGSDLGDKVSEATPQGE